MAQLDEQADDQAVDDVDDVDELSALPLNESLMRMSVHTLRDALRAARRKIDAHDLERATFLRHIARQRESESDMEKRIAGPLRISEQKLKEAQETIAAYRKKVTELVLERERYKAQL